MYHSIYKRPRKAERSLVKQITQSTSVLVSTLGDALTELIEESSNNNEGGDDEGTSTSASASASANASSTIHAHTNSNQGNDDMNLSDGSVGSKETSKSKVTIRNEEEEEGGHVENKEDEEEEGIQFDEKFKTHILEKLSAAHSDIIWQKEDSVSNGNDNDNNDSSNSHDPSSSSGVATTNVNVSNNNKQKDNPFSRVVVEPPAALLHGTLRYYNKFNGQWRIVVSNPVLRPRVNIDYTKPKSKSKGKKRNRKNTNISLWEQSKKTFCELKNLKRARTGGEEEDDDGESNSNSVINEEFPLSEDGAITLNGDLVILAYDDV